MKYPGSKRSNLFTKILGKVEKDLYKKVTVKNIDELVIDRVINDSTSFKNFTKRKARAIKALNSELNIIQVSGQ
jgi:hypothetical protein